MQPSDRLKRKLPVSSPMLDKKAKLDGSSLLQSVSSSDSIIAQQHKDLIAAYSQIALLEHKLAQARPKPPPPTHLQEQTRFVWVSSHSPMYQSLFRVVIREVNSYLCPLLMICPVGKCAYWFNINTEKWTKVANFMKPNIDLARIDENRWFGYYNCRENEAEPYEETRRPLLLSTDTGTSQELPMFNKPRYRSGLIYHKGIMYAFGGTIYTGIIERRPHERKSICRSIETCPIGDPQSWTLLPETMTRDRWDFTPCSHRNFLLLIGGCSAVVDSFNVLNQTISERIDLRLRSIGLQVAFVVEEELIIVCRELVARVSLKESSREVRMKEIYLRVDGLCVEIVVSGRFVYWTNWGVCFKAEVDEESVRISEMYVPGSGINSQN